MSHTEDFATDQDSNFVDNGFEKVEPPTTPEIESTQLPDEPIVQAAPEVSPASYSDETPLVDFGFTQPVSTKEPETLIPDTTAPLIPDITEPPMPDTSEPLVPEQAEVSEQPEPVPSPKISLPTKKSSSTDCCSWLKNIDPRVIDLVYWRDLKKTGIVFGSLLVLLLSLALFSVLSVVAYLSLAVLTVTLTFVVYKKVLGAVQKTTDGHPFKQLLEYDITLPEDKLHEVADAVMRNSTTAIKELRRLVLVEDLVDSLKFGLLLWVLTYIGAWFNGMTLIILAVIGVFTIPKFYETYKVQIDQYLDLARTQIKKVMAQIKEKIPIGKKKKEE